MSSPDVPGMMRSRGAAEASDPVLASKVTLPDLPGWAVTRPRIDKLITEGVRGPLTSVTGPPGAGKTMAIAAWAAASDRPGTLAWLTVDEHDNRPRVFWSYIVAALRQAGVATPQVRAGPGRVAVDHVFLARLASVLAGQDPPVVLVLDDLHLLAEPAILDVLAYVLRNARPGLHLVVASRMDPLLPLHRYRLAGQLAEIRADDLAFSTEESSSLLAHHGITLSADVLDRITGRTEGWAAGMRLAALSLQGRDAPEQFAKELEAGDSAITGYLVDEVLGAQPPSVREMLLRTSILDSVNAELVGELTGDPAAAGILPVLARANAFVRPLGQGWYRYHSLLAAVLRLKLQIEHRGQVPDLYRRAARWYQRNGSLGEAVRYAARSGDWPLAADMVVTELAVPRLIELRGDQLLAGTFNGMPNEPGWTQPQPWLVLAAMALSGGDCVDSLTTAEGILERLPADEQVPARLAAALIRLALSRRDGDLAAAAAAAGRAVTLSGQLPQDLCARHPEFQAQLVTARGAVDLWAGKLDEAARRFEAAASAAPPAGYERADALGYLALAEALRGRLGDAAARAGQAAEAMGSGGDDLTEHIIPGADVALAWVSLQRGDAQEAHARLKLAEAALRLCPDKLVNALACTVAAQRRLAGGQPAAALEMIRQARQDWSPSPPGWLELRLTLLESRAGGTAGDVEAAAVLDTVPEGSLDWWLAGARLSYDAGNGTRGRRGLEHALRMAAPEQVRLPFIMERAWLRPVLRRDPELAHAYRELLEPDVISADMVPLPRTPPDGQAAALVVEQLSEREREVLKLASGLLSTAEIASQMHLSVNTVKTHLRSIYRKLGATHRGEAVRRARELGLI